MSNRITIKTCEFCGKTFEAKKCDSLYCSPTCRKYAYIERDRRFMGLPVSDTYTSYKYKQKVEPVSDPTEKSQDMDFKIDIAQIVRDAFSQKGF
jgi:ribosome-binding protein aMBF1 (putative translation factor)